MMHVAAGIRRPYGLRPQLEIGEHGQHAADHPRHQPEQAGGEQLLQLGVFLHKGQRQQPARQRKGRVRHDDRHQKRDERVAQGRLNPVAQDAHDQLGTAVVLHRYQKKNDREQRRDDHFQMRFHSAFHGDPSFQPQTRIPIVRSPHRKPAPRAGGDQYWGTFLVRQWMPPPPLRFSDMAYTGMTFRSG